MKAWRSVRLALGLLMMGVLSLAGPRAAAAADRYALVVTGATGGDPYAGKYDEWRRALVNTLTAALGYPADHIIVLAERPDPGAGPATRAGVEQALGELRKRVMREDTLLVVLIGHGTAEGDDAKFNLVGPDLTATEWSERLKPIPGTIVFVNTTSGSFPFIRKLAAPRRIVLTATDSAVQQFETVFPDFFIKALTDPSADVDKNGRVSVWEAFVSASANVRQWFDQHAQLATERAVLDDSGEGVAHEAQPAQDVTTTPQNVGALARAVYFQRDALPATPAGSPEQAKRKAELQAQIEELRARKDEIPAEQYSSEMERLLLELARLSAAVRER